MNSAILACTTLRHYIEESSSSDESFTTLCLHVTSGYPSYGYLLDPNIKKGAYFKNNFFITDRDDIYCYMTNEYHLDSEEFPPTIILLNSLYGILVSLEIMRRNKIFRITITNSGKHYTISSENIEPVIIDPDLGNLYNETIPRIIARRVDNHFEYEVVNDDYAIMEYEYIYLFYNLLMSPNAKVILEKLFFWSCLQTSDNETINCNNLSLFNDFDTSISIKMREAPITIFGLRITKNSLKKFLQAWELRLQYCDAFTIVFLGQTLRFFEGEPLP